MKPGVLLVGNHPPPYGGVPTHIEYLSRHLESAGWRVHVLSFARSRGARREETPYRVHRPRLARWASLAIPSRPRVPASASAFRSDAPKAYLTTLAISRQIARLIRRHEISLVSAYHLLPSGLAAAWACDDAGLPLVTTVFGEIYADPVTHEKRRAEVQFVVDRSHTVLSCSRHCAASLDSWRLREPAGVVYYGVDLDRFSPSIDSGPMRVRLGIGRDQPVILYVGRFVRDMGLHTAIDAIPLVVSQRNDAMFVLVGATGPMLAEAERVRADWPANVRVLADLPGADLPLAYAAADVVVAPSINQRACLGLALIEAQASGKPVIGCSVGGTSEAVSENTGVMIQPERPEELARALLAFVATPERRLAMGAAGRRLVEERFDYRTTCRQMESIFHRALF